MITENCDLCQIEVYNSNDERRFIPNELINKKIVCIDCIEDNKQKEQKMINKYDKLVFWRFVGGPTFTGFSNGTTWNGWDNIQVNEEQFKPVKKWLLQDMGIDGFNEFMRDYQVKTNDNKYSFAYGCTTEIVNNEDIIIGNIRDDLHPWINDGIAKIQKEYGLECGDVSPGLNIEFQEAFDALAKCIYKQLKEHDKL
jgi:hypothetical protein